MIWLIVGLVLWYGAHLLKRWAPSRRAALSERMGDASKGVIAATLAVAIFFFWLGYRQAEVVALWYFPWAIHVNNLLMIFAVVLFGIGSSKSRLRSKMRHPMLTGASVWAVAHLLVNGDLASLVLFGGLLIWAQLEIVVINRAEPDYVPFEGGTTAGDVRLILISVVVFAAIAGIHSLVGPWPFPS